MGAIEQSRGQTQPQRRNDDQASPRDNHPTRVDLDGSSPRLASLSVLVLRDQKALLFLQSVIGAALLICAPRLDHGEQ